MNALNPTVTVSPWLSKIQCNFYLEGLPIKLPRTFTIGLKLQILEKSLTYIFK